MSAYEPKNKKIETPVEPVVEEVKDEASPKTIVIQSETDAYVQSVMTTQAKNVDDIKLEKLGDNPDVLNILRLPKQVDDALKNHGLTPRWINKNKRAIDHAIFTRRWVIVNRTLFPKLPKHLFTANGTIENGDLILMCMAEERAKRLREIPGERSSERIKNLPMNRWKNSNGSEKVGFYKPAYTAEKDGDTAVSGITPDLQENTNQ